MFLSRGPYLIPPPWGLSAGWQRLICGHFVRGTGYSDEPSSGDTEHKENFLLRVRKPPSPTPRGSEKQAGPRHAGELGGGSGQALLREAHGFLGSVPISLSCKKGGSLATQEGSPRLLCSLFVLTIRSKHKGLWPEASKGSQDPPHHHVAYLFGGPAMRKRPVLGAVHTGSHCSSDQ